MKIITKTAPLLFGISLLGVTGYFVYWYFKKDDDDDDDLGTFPRISNYKTLKIQIPKDLVRAVIGRNGKNIKLIQDESQTRINFKDETEDSISRTCIIRGTAAGCAIAENLIQEFIAKQPVLDIIKIAVPQKAVGRIIGRCGEQITDISTRSGALIKIAEGNRGATTRSITIRGTKDQIMIAKSLIEETVDLYQRSHLKTESTLAKREPRGPAKSPSPKPPVESPQAERISLIPGQTDAQFEVFVSAVIDPSHFWLQIVGPKATELDLLVEEMTEYYSKQDNRDLHVLNSLERGDLVSAAFQHDEKWYRAEVLKVLTEDGREPQVELYFVDYGDTDTIPSTEVYELRTDFLQLTFQAIECYLARVEPINETWTDEALDKFEEWAHVAHWKKLSARINGSCVREKTRAKREGSPVPGIDLYDVINDQDVDIAEELVKHGFAVFKKDADLRSTSSRTTSINSVDSNT